MKISKKANVSFPEVAMLAASRAMTGAGLGMMIAKRLAPEKRKAISWTLFALGALSALSTAFDVGQSSSEAENTY